MASLVAENWVCFNGSDDNSNGVEVAKFDTALLVSLLEESTGEKYKYDEELNRVIRSLEAEINGGKLEEGHCLAMETPELVLLDEKDGQNWLASVEFGSSDNNELVPSSPSYDMNWSNDYMDQCGVDSESLVETVGVCDYSWIYYTSEELGFSPLWHKTQQGS